MSFSATQPDSTPQPEPDAVALALDLLAAIAEDAGLRPSYRIAARRHLRELERVSRRAEGQQRLAALGQLGKVP